MSDSDKPTTDREDANADHSESVFSADTDERIGFSTDFMSWWPSWLPKSHVAFAFLLWLAVLSGYWVSLEGPEEPNRNDYMRKAKLEMKTIPESASVDERQKIDQHNESIDKQYVGKLEKAQKEYQVAKEKWDDSGKEFWTKVVESGRNVANWTVACWLVFCLFVYCLNPLRRMISKELGAGFSMVLVPVATLGILFAAASILLGIIPQSGWETVPRGDTAGHNLLAVFGVFISKIVYPVCDAILKVKEFAVDKWMVPLILVVVTASIGWGKYRNGQAKG